MDASVVDLGASGDPRFAGILVPSDERKKIGIGVTRQFLEDAETHHQKYFDINYSTYLLNDALKAIGARNDVNLILDIGSGSGPSVFALINKFPDAHIVATDISPNLLAILRVALAEKGKSKNCTTICLDLNRPWFKGQPFDLAIGSAILHHLIEPHRLVEEVFAAIRPGAAVVFFEPFEPGYAMMALIYKLILAHANHVNPLGGNLVDFFRGKITAIAKMKCEPKDPELYAGEDDKWMFTRAYFEEIGERTRAARTIIYPINHSDSPFTNHLKVQLKLGLGVAHSAMPEWAWELIAEIEASHSESCKRDLLFGGCVVFVK